MAQKQFYLLLTCFLLSCNTTLIAQYQFYEHFDLNGCRYKVDTLYNNKYVASSFFDCAGNIIKVYQKGVDSMPQKLYEAKEWEYLLKSEISKLTRLDISINIVYGLVVDSSGTIINIEKLSKGDYEKEIEDKIVDLLKNLKWQPAKLGNQKVNFYLTFSARINLM
ncbi:MAG: hypothetical protein EAZ55_07015 [Cytophagales bacterium]|nr:MAG: hypothetical protein EAZ55_07015 [Cytophagales bacterium]